MHFRPPRLRHSLPSDGAPAQHDLGDQFAQSFHVRRSGDHHRDGRPRRTAAADRNRELHVERNGHLRLHGGTAVVANGDVYDVDAGGGDGCDRSHLLRRLAIIPPAAARSRNWLIHFHRPCNSSPSPHAVWWTRDRIKGGSGPIPGGTFQDFPIPQEGGCNIPTTAAAYSLNVSVVPSGPLGYLTIWPAGEGQPVVATLNSLDGRIKADAAIVPAGVNGAVSVYVTQTTNVILDINGYFAPVSGSTLAFYPLTPCRVADTRKAPIPRAWDRRS